MLYLLNSPVLTAYGQYRYLPCTLEDARNLLAEGFTSAVGHTSTAELLSRLLQMDVPLNRIAITMKPGDRALVLNLKTRLPEDVVIDAATLQNIPYEFAILVRTS